MSSQNTIARPYFDSAPDNTPMSEDVAGMLSALCQAAGKSFDPNLTQRQAHAQINILRDKLDFQLRTRGELAANLPGKVTSSRVMSSDGDA